MRIAEEQTQTADTGTTKTKAAWVTIITTAEVIRPICIRTEYALTVLQAAQHLHQVILRVHHQAIHRVILQAPAARNRQVIYITAVHHQVIHTTRQQIILNQRKQYQRKYMFLQM